MRPRPAEPLGLQGASSMTEIIQMSAIPGAGGHRILNEQIIALEPACNGPRERKNAADTGASALPKAIGNQRRRPNRYFGAFLRHPLDVARTCETMIIA
jgi:hypothetical protein